MLSPGAGWPAKTQTCVILGGPARHRARPGSQPATHLHQVCAGVEDPERSKRVRKTKGSARRPQKPRGRQGAQQAGPQGQACSAVPSPSFWRAKQSGGQKPPLPSPNLEKLGNPPWGDWKAEVGLTSHSPPASPQSWHGGPGSSCPTPDDRALSGLGGGQRARTGDTRTGPAAESEGRARPREGKLGPLPTLPPLTCRGRLALARRLSAEVGAAGTQPSAPRAPAPWSSPGSSAPHLRWPQTWPPSPCPPWPQAPPDAHPGSWASAPGG